MKYQSIMALAFATALAVGSGACNKQKAANADSDSVADIESADATAPETAPEDSLTAFNYTADFFRDSKKKGNGQDSTYMETASGLRYAVVKEGTGSSPKAEDSVTVHYTGRLINGKIFDSSVLRGEPTSFPLNGVIKGWTEGLQTMKEGGITEFYIPADLAYGEQGTPDGSIPPGAPLIFRVELIKVN